MKSLMIKLGNFFFHHRNRVFPLMMVAAVLLIRPRFPANNHRMDIYLDLIGLLICAAGQTLRVLAVGYEYIKRGGARKQIYAGRLIQGGMFAHSRNPLYLGNILIFCGITVVFSAPLAYAVGIPLVLFIYACIILAEEEFLRNKFGAEFDEYSARVNRLWPNWTGFSESIEDMTFQWKRVISKEFGTAFGWIIAAIALRILTLYLTSPDLYRSEIYALLLSLIPVGLLYLWVRWMKKSKNLADEDPSTMDR